MGWGNAFSLLGEAAWTAPVTARQLSQVLARLSEDLGQGAIGIGLLLGYAPDVDPLEYLEVARLAAQARVPTFTHFRDLVEMLPTTKIDGAEEIVRAASRTGAHMHYCHLNSTSGPTSTVCSASWSGANEPAGTCPRRPIRTDREPRR